MEAFRLTYEQYLSKGFTQVNPSALLFSAVDLLPSTVNFVASCGGAIVGTVTTVIAENIDVPSTELYPEEIRTLTRDPSRRASEGTKFAFKDGRSKRETSEFVRRLFFWWKHYDVSDVLAVVHPKHTAFWKRSLRFKPRGAMKPCNRVAGSPGVLLHLDVNNQDDLKNTSKRSKAFRKELAPAETFPAPYLLSSSEVVALLMTEPKTITKASPNYIQQLVVNYPEAARCIERAILKAKLEYLSRDTLKIERFDAKTCVWPLIEVCESIAQNRGIQISVPAEDELPCLLGDYERFIEVFYSILLELLYSSEPGEHLCINVSTKHSSLPGAKVVLEVIRQSNKPTSESQHEILFSNFRRIRPSIARTRMEKLPKPCDMFVEKADFSHRANLIELLGDSVSFRHHRGATSVELRMPSGDRDVRAATFVPNLQNKSLHSSHHFQRALLVGGTEIEMILLSRWLDTLNIGLDHRPSSVFAHNSSLDQHLFVIIEGQTPCSFNQAFLKQCEAPVIGIVSHDTDTADSRYVKNRLLTVLRKPINRQAFLQASKQCMDRSGPTKAVDAIEKHANLG